MGDLGNCLLEGDKVPRDPAEGEPPQQLASVELCSHGFAPFLMKEMW